MFTRHRYKLTLAYDGTDFAGWQKQEPPDPEAEPDPRTGERPRTALRTVQHVVEQTVRTTIREEVNVKGASRTDSGVHAGGAFPDGTPGGQVAAFTTDPRPEQGRGWPAERGADRLVRALNGALPRDVLVLRAEEVPLDFDPITDATSKQYTYTIATGETRPLWDRRTVFHTWHTLDAQRMRDAAAALVGEHDFAAFAQANHGRKSTVRTIFACDVEAAEPAADPGDRVRIRVRGSGFLYNMVRIIAGTLMEAGRGRIGPGDIERYLREADRSHNHCPTLPPQGLRLDWISYDPR